MEITILMKKIWHRLIHTKFIRSIVTSIKGTTLSPIGIRLRLRHNERSEVARENNSKLLNLFYYHSLLSEYSNILHIGAGYGLHAIFLAKIASKGQIYVIENNKILQRRLIKNMRLNHVQNVVFVDSLLNYQAKKHNHNIDLIHISERANITLEEVIKLIKNNDTINLVWDVTSRQEGDRLVGFLNSSGMRCGLLCKGRLFPTDRKDLFGDFVSVVVSREKNQHIHTAKDSQPFVAIPRKQNGISGFSLLRTASLYPFDLCYESVLEFVDEFILAIDTKPSAGEEQENKRLINAFLSKTKYRDKIKILEFDFKVRFYSGYNPPGRWIADVNNRIIECCSNDICVYVMADEMYLENAQSEFANCAESSDDALNYYFLHFFGDLSHIRDPRTVYTHAIRVFKKDKFYSYHDGFSFAPISDNSVKIREARLPIYHIGYVVNFLEKAKAHAGTEGIHAKADESHYKGVQVIPIRVPFPKYLYLEGYPSSEKIKKYL